MTLRQYIDTLNVYINLHKEAADLPVSIHGNSDDFDVNMHSPNYHRQNFIMISHNPSLVLVSTAVSKSTYRVFCNDGYDPQWSFMRDFN